MTGIRVFRAEKMEWTPFQSDDQPHQFKMAGIRYVSRAQPNDIFVASSIFRLRKLGAWPATFAVWTNEPRFDLHLDSPAHVDGIYSPVHIMNAYTGVYLDSYLHLPRDAILPDRDALLASFAAKPWRAVMLATFYPPAARNLGLPFPRSARTPSLKPSDRGRLLRDNVDVDLTQRRQALAEWLYTRDFCDIYGLRWPASITTAGESCFNNWRQTKHAILQGYAINLAFENTIAPHYVSEKIWDAIRGACLPVYHGGDGSSIYNDFPRDGFIDSAGKSVVAVADEIMTMNRGEAADRYEMCLDAYLMLVREQRYLQSYEALLKRTAEFLEGIAAQ